MDALGGSSHFSAIKTGIEGLPLRDMYTTGRSLTAAFHQALQNGPSRYCPVPLLQSLVCGTLLHSRILVGCVMWTYQHCVGMPALCGQEVRPAGFLIELRQLECHVQLQMLPGAVLFQPKRINAVLIRRMAHLSGSGSRNCPALLLLDLPEGLLLAYW